MLKIKKTSFVLFFLVTVAFVIAVVQPFGLSPDYKNYEFFFQQVRSDFLGELKENRFEPGFLYSAGGLAKVFDSDIFIYGVFVVASMLVKLIYMRKLPYKKHFLYVACVFYAFRFFPLLELTQLRASLAVSFIFAACFYIWKGERSFGIAACAIAVSCHYSSLMLSPFVFLPKFNRKTSLIFASLIFIFLYLVSHYLIGIVGNYLLVFQGYNANGYGERAVNSLSPVFFPEFFMLLMALFYWRDMTDNMQRIITIQLVGFAIFYGLINFPVVAVRGREFFSVLWTLFVVQSAVCTSRLKRAIYIFIAASIALSIYQYVILDFFHR